MEIESVQKLTREEAGKIPEVGERVAAQRDSELDREIDHKYYEVGSAEEAKQPS